MCSQAILILKNNKTKRKTENETNRSG